METAMNQLIEKLNKIKENDCKTLQEVLFFDGILAVIESSKFIEIEKKQIINAFNDGYNECENYSQDRSTDAIEYYETFNS